MTEGQEKHIEREFEVGKDEAWFANIKRTFDEYQHESLETIKRLRAYSEKVLSDAQVTDNTKNNIANQALQNAVETANMVGKQAVRHGDIAIDHQWNIDEQANMAAIIAAAVAKVLADMAKPTK